MYKKYSERIDKLSAVFASGTLGRKGNEKKKVFPIIHGAWGVNSLLGILGGVNL